MDTQAETARKRALIGLGLIGLAVVLLITGLVLGGGSDPDSGITALGLGAISLIAGLIVLPRATKRPPADPRTRKMRIAGGVTLLLGLAVGAGGNPDAANFARLLLLIGAGLLVAAWIIKPEAAERRGQQAS